MELNEGWEPDWGDENQQKWMLRYKYDDREYCVDFFFVSKHLPDKYYFKSRKIGEQLIEEFRDDLEYLFY